MGRTRTCASLLLAALFLSATLAPAQTKTTTTSGKTTTPASKVTWLKDPSKLMPMRAITNAQRQAVAKKMAAQRAAALAARKQSGLATRSGKQVVSGARAIGAGATLNAPSAVVPGFPIAVNPGDLYFGIYPNYANSPLPVGGVKIILGNGGSGYTNPTVTITDAYNPAAAIPPVSITPTVVGGVITAITLSDPGSGFTAPVVTITDPAPPDTILPAVVSAQLDPATVVAGTGIRKFVDTLPGICELGQANNLGQCLPLANFNADTTSFPGSDFYRIGLKDYSEKMHSDLPPTQVRGYFQLNADMQTAAGAGQHYLGPLILAQRNRPVRVLFKNMLPTSNLPASNLAIPVDTTYMGAGAGPSTPPGTDCSVIPTPANCYAQNRATLHLHGGNTPWISDGTTHQWITPANDPSIYPKGLSFQNVPDMITPPQGVNFGTPGRCPTTAINVCFTPADNDGLATFYWPNQQSGRLMMYHDHAYGITRLNAYSGEAAGYLLVDPAQETALRAATVPGTIITDQTGAFDLVNSDLGHVIPLVIQDKTFVDATTLAAQDPTWKWGTQPGSAVTGDFWFPHMYMTNQWPDAPDLSGANPMGRWDYGPWFAPPQDPTTFVPQGRPFPCTAAGGVATTCPGTPNPSGTPEAFMDTPIINGTAYPVLHVRPEAYRFHILSVGNDRSLNLQLYQAYDPNTNTVGSGTEVKMVPSIPGSWPAGWPTPDARDGGWPDPATAGPNFVEIGTEGGLLPNPAVIQNRPIGYDYNRRSITVLNVLEKALFLGPAERADVVVDFSNFAGKTLVLYNDAPAPVPAFDSRIDYYTGDPDQTSTGGAPTTLPGYGPNTRTLMQIVVDQPGSGAPAFNLPALKAALPNIFRATQDPILVPEKAYGYPTNTYSKIYDYVLNFTDPGATSPTPHPMESKTIQELFTLDYGRMNATLGVELPFTNFRNQTTIPYGYIDPPTEVLKDGQEQIWKITHNGVDTHFIHFHLFTVQVLNRVGWDGAITPPDPNEFSWKDTVRMNPLEDIIVAVKPVKQNVPWPLPDSYRPMDVTMPAGMPDPGFLGVDPNNLPLVPNNDVINFGWEYVWHCHILGHEENDMMRAIIFQPAPETPTNAAAYWNPFGGALEADLSYTDASASETRFEIQRDVDPTFPAATLLTASPLPPLNAGLQGTSWGQALTLADPAAGAIACTTPPCPVYYRVRSVNTDGYSINAYTVNPPGPTKTTLISPWSAPVAVLPSVTATALVAPNAVYGTTAQVTVTVTSPQGGPVPGNVDLTVNGGAPTTQALVGGATIFNLTGLAVGTYNLVATYPNSNYIAGSTATGTLTITAAPLMITADNLTAVYGAALPAFTVTPTGLVAPDTLASLGFVQTCSTTPTTPVNVGTYPIDCSTSTITAPNYTVTFAPGTLSITPATVTITASSASMNYGGPVPTITAGFAGFVNGDTSAVLTAQPVCSTTATVSSPVASYPSTCSGAAAANYAFSYVGGTVTVAAVPLTITANNATRAYGAPDPVFTASYAGFVGTDTPASLTGSLVCTTTATAASPAGNYPINCSGQTSTNYNITYVAGTLTITAAPGLTITANNASRSYGSANPAFSVSYAGFLPGDNPGNSLSGTLTCSTTATPASPVGSYPINCSGLTSGKYAITWVAGSLSVTSVPLSITANNATRVWGAANPAFTASYAGFVNGDTPASLTGAMACSTTATPTSAVGTYPINCSGQSSTNYAITYAPGTLTVTTAVQLSPLSLTFGPQNLGTTSAPQTVTLRNLGGSTMTFSIGITANFVRSGTCGTTLAAAATCTINVRFRPTTTGPLAGTLTVNATVAGAGAVALSGTGNGAIAGVTPATTSATPYNFGGVTRGQVSAPLTVVVANTGSTPLTFNATNAFTLNGANPAQFTLTPGGLCVNGGVVPAGGSCSVTVNFAPRPATALGAKFATVTIRSNAVNGVQRVYVTGTAQ